MNIKQTFLSLVDKTYPYGHEAELLHLLPNLKKDIVGNYYTIIGSNRPYTMFTSHLDSACREQTKVRTFIEEKDGIEFVYTDGKSILGSDDKAGVTIMLYMIENNIEGLYYFFIGEEVGGIGSSYLVSEYDKVEYLDMIERCISFDRRGTESTITHQSGTRCCSDSFTRALIGEYSKCGIHLKADPTGIFTDSYNFIGIIPECTNISVGYYNEHKHNEYQDLTFLEEMCYASVKVNWNVLPTDNIYDEDEDDEEDLQDFETYLENLI